jgi:hypothetical protein
MREIAGSLGFLEWEKAQANSQVRQPIHLAGETIRRLFCISLLLIINLHK